MKIVPTLLLIAFLTSSVAHAQVTAFTILHFITIALGQFVAVGVGIALVVFIWGLVRFIANAGDEKGVAEGKQRMVWGIVGLFLVVTVWGVVTLLTQLFGVDASQPGGNRCPPPQIDLSGGGTMEPC